MGALQGTARFAIARLHTTQTTDRGGVLDRATGSLYSFPTVDDARAGLAGIEAEPSTHGRPEIMLPGSDYEEID